MSEPEPEAVADIATASLSPETAAEALVVAMQVPVPVILWGEPGIGKSAYVRALAASIKKAFACVSLVHCEPQDVNGIRWPDLANKRAVWLLPEWYWKMKEAGGGVLLFDELTLAPLANQGAALTVFQEGEVGGERLPPGTSIIAAANRADSTTGAFELTAAASNRLCHLEWPRNFDGLLTSLVTGRWQEPTMKRLPSDWRTQAGRGPALVASYLRHRPTAAQICPTDPVRAGQAWPSHRSWTNAAHLLHAAEVLGHSLKGEVAAALVSGCVGGGPAHELVTFMCNAELLDPEVILADPLGVAIPDRGDLVHATLDSVVAAAIRPHPNYEARNRAAWVLIDRVFREKQQDLVVPAVRILAGGTKVLDVKLIPREAIGIFETFKKAGVTFAVKNQ